MNPTGKSKIDPLKYWKSLLGTEVRPIAQLAMEILSIPATSSPIERILSQAGLATNNHRNKASFDLLNSQCMVYCNYFVEDVNLF
uniref:HAT C-terminal dimerisation domain-containing protein n=1 Tax=Ditylenchus dipsaci TaxID=166011 RepID=A0A915ENJ2_9BILA